jgi:hypothetical protein
MVTVLEDCSTKEQHSLVHFLWAKGLTAKDIHKEMFMVGSVYHVKRFAARSKNSLRDIQKSQMMPDQVQK